MLTIHSKKNKTGPKFFAASFTAIALSFGAGKSIAATFTLDFTGDTSTSSSTSNSSYDQTRIQLINTVTGTNSISGFTLAADDTVSGTVTLSNTVTVPSSTGSSDVYLNLGAYGGVYRVGWSQTFTFYNNGVQITPPDGFSQSVYSRGVLGFNASSSTPASSFSFDKIVYSATQTGSISGIANGDWTLDLPSAPVVGTPTFMSYTTTTPSVPLPGTVWLMLSGLGGLGAIARKRR